MTMASGSGSLSRLLRRAEFDPVSALAGHQQVLWQRLLEGVSGAEVMAALAEFVDGLIIGRYRNAMQNETDPNTKINWMGFRCARDAQETVGTKVSQLVP